MRRLQTYGIIVLLSAPAAGQTNSLMRLPAQQAAEPGTSAAAAQVGAAPAPFATLAPKEPSRASTRAIEMASMIAVPPVPQRKFKVNDLINIIVRQQKKYEADAKLDTKKQWDIDGKLSEWFRFHPGNKLGSDKLSNGDPGFKFGFNNKYKTDGENEREDTFTTRIQATVIDVKPNGNLVLEASMEEQHDEEHFTITLTGTCRSEDVTASNSVLSTQIANLVLVEKNKGAVRDSATRGWIPKILDFAKPF